MQLKIGAYIRVSTEEQAQVVEGSLDSQRHRIKSFIEIKTLQDNNWGKLIELYIDDGYSAKDTKRPAYQRMMVDIKKSKINLILVTDLSRLSRNILDFCNLLNDLDACKAKFLSIKEQFDTSTPAGEMMIYNMINLAQFERKQTSERVSLNFHARSMRGLINGGPTVLGFDRNPENPGIYLVNRDESKLVKQIFNLFLEQGSLAKTIRKLELLGIKPKVTPRQADVQIQAGRWTTQGLSTLLQNPTYIGIREVNKRFKDQDQDALKHWQRYASVTASWPGIIEPETFYRVQNVIEENKNLERTRISNGERRSFLLTGIVNCPECGLRLTTHSAHSSTKAHRYYSHVKRKGVVLTCKIKRVRADDLEQAVVEHLTSILHKGAYFDDLRKNIQLLNSGDRVQVKTELQVAEAALADLVREIRGTFKLQSGIDSSSESFKLVVEQLEGLAQQRKELTEDVERMRSLVESDSGIAEAIFNLKDRLLEAKRGWPKLTVMQQKRFLRRLITRLEIYPDKVGVFYWLADKASNVIPVDFTQNGSLTNKNSGIQSEQLLSKVLKGEPPNLEVPNLRVVRNGADGRSRTCDHQIRSLVLYPAELRPHIELDAVF